MLQQADENNVRTAMMIKMINFIVNRDFFKKNSLLQKNKSIPDLLTVYIKNRTLHGR